MADDELLSICQLARQARADFGQKGSSKQRVLAASIGDELRIATGRSGSRSRRERHSPAGVTLSFFVAHCVADRRKGILIAEEVHSVVQSAVFPRPPDRSGTATERR